MVTVLEHVIKVVLKFYHVVAQLPRYMVYIVYHVYTIIWCTISMLLHNCMVNADYLAVTLLHSLHCLPGF